MVALFLKSARSLTLSSTHHPTSLRQTLRAATSEAHASLDHDIGSTLAHRSGYVAFLRGSHAAVAGIEDVLARFGVLSPAARATLIEADLASLGEAVPTNVTPAWRPTTLAEAFGSAYVVEGSALGGVVLAEKVERALGADATRYLRLRGAETALAWRTFLSRLEAWGDGATANERAMAATGARATFGVYRAAFVSAGVIAGTRG